MAIETNRLDLRGLSVLGVVGDRLHQNARVHREGRMTLVVDVLQVRETMMQSIDLARVPIGNREQVTVGGQGRIGVVQRTIPSRIPLEGGLGSDIDVPGVLGIVLRVP